MDKNNIKKKFKYSLRFLPDKMYVKLYYRINTKKKLDLKNPKTFNEKLNWLKFNDRNPIYSIVVDKLKNRKYIEDKIGKEYLISLLGVWENFDDIDFDKLPNKFVLKTNHDSGGIVICNDKAKLNLEKARKKINESLNCNFYYIGREWQYKMIKPMIICEELIGNKEFPPEDYKFSCFNGKPDNVMVCSERETGTPKYYFFDMNWNFKRYNYWGKMAPEGFTLPKPQNFETMIKIATILSEPYYYSRIDLYNINGKIYFGEVTLCPNSGFDANLTNEADILFGAKMHIPVLDD